MPVWPPSRCTDDALPHDVHVFYHEGRGRAPYALSYWRSWRPSVEGLRHRARGTRFCMMYMASCSVVYTARGTRCGCRQQLGLLPELLLAGAVAPVQLLAVSTEKLDLRPLPHELLVGGIGLRRGCRREPRLELLQERLFRPAQLTSGRFSAPNARSRA